MKTWLPYSSVLDTDLIKVVEAKDSYLFLDNGKKIYDAISSWWCKPLGHKPPFLQKAIIEQLQQFEHHIPNKAYSEGIESLSSSLAFIVNKGNQDNNYKVMYASDGSSAVEIAMKLSVETRILQNNHKKNRFIALNNSYHGETLFALSVCGINSFKSKYQNLLIDNFFIDNIPYVNSLDFNHENYPYEKLLQFLENIKDKITAFIFEPVVQGAYGMKFIDINFLKFIINWCQNNDIHVISDEIMVGLGRIGYYCVTTELLGFKPDICCFAKNLTAGIIPMSAVVIKDSIYSNFSKNNTVFMHSHTHSCNAIATNVANYFLKYLLSNEYKTHISATNDGLKELAKILSNKYQFIKNTRVLGSILAFELNVEENKIKKIFSYGIEIGIYLKPIANTLYIMPPINNFHLDYSNLKFLLQLVLNKIT